MDFTSSVSPTSNNTLVVIGEVPGRQTHRLNLCRELYDPFHLQQSDIGPVVNPAPLWVEYHSAHVKQLLRALIGEVSVVAQQHSVFARIHTPVSGDRKTEGINARQFNLLNKK